MATRRGLMDLASLEFHKFFPLGKAKEKRGKLGRKGTNAKIKAVVGEAEMRGSGRSTRARRRRSLKPAIFE